MKSLLGTGVALVTPFTAQGTVDTAALKRIVRYQLDNGINYLVVLGTTGESVTLSTEEKTIVLDTVLAENQSQVPVVLGVGGNDTAEVIRQLKKIDPQQIDAVLSVSPMYNKPTQEGIFRHFEAVAQASPVPVLLYNVPGRTSSNMAPETVVRIANQCPNIIGIKEAAGDLVQALKLIRAVPKDFLVISGDDMIALSMVLAGGHGVISVIGEGLPKAFSEMIRLGLNGEVKRAFALHYQMMPVIDYIFEEGNPAGIKALFNVIGLCSNHLRLPLVPVSPALYEKIEIFVNDFNAIER